jgi:hypothetical protein
MADEIKTGIVLTGDENLALQDGISTLQTLKRVASTRSHGL